MSHELPGHRCPTGWHVQPHYVCHDRHGCRCPGCRLARTEANRRTRLAPTPRVLMDVAVAADPAGAARVLEEDRLRIFAHVLRSADRQETT